MQAAGRRGTTLWALLAAAALATGACGDSGGAEGRDDPAQPKPGTTSFVSADDAQGDSIDDGSGDFDSGAGGAVGAPESERGAGDDADGRTVEEGDVYRTFGGDLLLNLNAYRGLQVIDLSNLAAPAIVGRLETSGTPVELYTSGDHAYVLMNNWRGYWGGRDDIAVETFEGGVVLSVDLSDPTAPVVVDSELVPGWIYKSRMVKGGGQEALYIVSQEYGYRTDASGQQRWTTSTTAKSFGAAAGQLAPASELDLGGWIADIAATPRALLVARTDWERSGNRSLLSVVDISSPDGTMIEGDEIQVEGMVQNQFNMDLRGDVLRVVSGSSWSGSNTNHVETFDASDIHDLRRIDHETFGDGENLFATLFLENSGFFVTYLRTDPFHAFEITDAGDAIERSEFIVSGWNDFFRPVLAESRLIGIGTNDEQGRTMAVSLYDVTDLSNPSPLVEREEVQADNSWSEASWDHRAFSVLENAVAVQGPGGVTETGLVLLPFTGWNAQDHSYTASVQIFTFSADTLTRRGVMDHGTPVHRTFQPAPATAANLSQQTLSLFDAGDPDQPAEHARLDLAPDYTRVLTYGSHAARLREPSRWYGSYGAPPEPAEVQIVSLDDHPDSAQAVASFEIPAGASIHKVGDELLVAVHHDPVDTSSWPYTWETTLQVFDLATPAQPVARGTLTTREIQPGHGGYGYYYDGGPVADCFDCGGWYGGWYGMQAQVHAVGEALAFVEYVQEQENLGTERICSAWPRQTGSCAYGERFDGCTLMQGYQSCRTHARRTACSGGFYECTYDEDEASFACVPVDASQIATDESCHDRDAWRHWNRFEVEVVDLTQPDAPQLRNTITSPRREEAVGVLARGDDLWLSFKKPHTIPGDSRPYVRFFTRRVDLSNPALPVESGNINVPGQLLEVDGDTLFTRDQVWGRSRIEAAVARLQLAGDVAVLQAHRTFPDQVVETVALDGAGHVLVSHREGWYYGYGYGARSGGAGAGADPGQQLTILDAGSTDLSQIATTDVDTWATLKDARAGRALFQVPGGLLVFNLDQPATPWPQAYFATRGWPQELVVEGRSILFAAGPYGIYRFDLDETNLQAP